MGSFIFFNLAAEGLLFLTPPEEEDTGESAVG